MSDPERERSWRESFALFTDPRMLKVVGLGFASGLPSPFVFSNLSIWLRDEGVGRTEITALISLLATPYAINFLWAPLVDRMRLPFMTARFGRRRGWALLAQTGVVLALVGLAFSDPSAVLLPTLAFALLLSTASATQDITLDAFRIEYLPRDELGPGSTVYVWGWHLGGTLVGGAGGLVLADLLGWSAAYLAVVPAVLFGMWVVLTTPEPDVPLDAPGAAGPGANLRAAGSALARGIEWVRRTAVEPFAEFMRRDGWVLILTFVFVFKLGDALLGRMAFIFYRDIGFELGEIAQVSKLFGLAATLFGLALGGAVVSRFGITKGLLAGGFAAAGTNLLFAYLASVGPELPIFRLAVIVDNIAGGIATVAFVAFLSALCNTAYTATQYALLNSLGNLARIWFAGVSGAVVDGLDGDWATFFVLTTMIALGGLPLLIMLMRRHPLDATARDAGPPSGPTDPPSAPDSHRAGVP